MTKPKTLSQPEEYWAAWNKAAKASGTTLSEWIARQCNAALPAKVRKRLPPRPPANRPRKEQP